MINVNIEHPERNREVHVHFYRDVIKDGLCFDAFTIDIECDPRDHDNDRYHAHLISANEVMVTMPSMLYSRIHEADAFAESK